MRAYLETNEIRPKLVLCSSALRARQTLARVLPGLGTALEVRIEPVLYTFDAGVLIDRLRRVPPQVASVLVVGHNPALQDLAVRVTDRGDRLDDLVQKFPTGALAEIEVGPDSWETFADPRRLLTRFVSPREVDE
jgi:phosphohistidine phosphatase